MTPTQDEYHLRVYFHVVRDSNGNGGPSEAQVLEAFNVLNDTYNQHNIFFHIFDCNDSFIDAIDYIDDDANVPVMIPSQIYSINAHQDGIDIYLGGENTNYQYNATSNVSGGKADGVGENSAFLVTGTWTLNPPLFYTQ